MNQNAPWRILKIVEKAMNDVTAVTQYEPFFTKWTREEKDHVYNFMIDSLNYPVQTDSYSCGFYCISTA